MTYVRTSHTADELIIFGVGALKLYLAPYP